jgi:uncharacterized Fe-S cluster-containing radical SAM superfamily protein
MTSARGVIDTPKFSAHLRRKAIDVVNQKVLITRFINSDQEKDLTIPPNCAGYGRIRHFRRQTAVGWPENPLPIDPAANRLGIPPGDLLEAQVFQNAACNWRCWYCYVPFNLLSANENFSDWFNAAELLDSYQKEIYQAKVIDLSGGQPDLTPEWIPWMMRELLKRGLEKQVYLWSDDNLSNDYFWQFLAPEDIELICSYRNYGKVCCFKGFDSSSFAFNTKAAPELFAQQFRLFERYLTLGIDIYAYATFTAAIANNIEKSMNTFVDRLQEIHTNLPLRTVPLQIRSFSTTQARPDPARELAIRLQEEAIFCWNAELDRRFSEPDRKRPVYEVSMRH